MTGADPVGNHRPVHRSLSRVRCPVVYPGVGTFTDGGRAHEFSSSPTSIRRTLGARSQASTDWAAARIAAIVTCGRDTMETCELAASVIVAPAVVAIRRCVSGGITRSSVPTTAQLGSAFHAGVADGAVFASPNTV